MSNALPNGLTRTLGYFNGNKWPVQISLPKFNVILILQPGEYVLDRNRKKINDPSFEVYPQLSREVGDTLVPFNIIPVVTSETAPARSTNPVRGTTKFGLDSNGVYVWCIIAAAAPWLTSP
jgi:hypothetical protein